MPTIEQAERDAQEYGACNCRVGDKWLEVQWLNFYPDINMQGFRYIYNRTEIVSRPQAQQILEGLY